MQHIVNCELLLYNLIIGSHIAIFINSRACNAIYALLLSMIQSCVNWYNAVYLNNSWICLSLNIMIIMIIIVTKIVKWGLPHTLSWVYSAFKKSNYKPDISPNHYISGTGSVPLDIGTHSLFQILNWTTPHYVQLANRNILSWCLVAS